MRIRYKQAYKAAGFATNRRKEEQVTSAVIAAQQIPDSFVHLDDSQDGVAHVTSMQDGNSNYQVTGALTATPYCTCPQGQLHYMCKHVVKVIGVSQGYSGAQIIQALGTRAGTSQAGLSNLHCNLSSQAAASTDALTDLESTFALSKLQPESEVVPKPASKAAIAAIPAHDSAACQQEVQAATQRMWESCGDNSEMQQHLVSQLSRAEGVLAGIQASHKTGTAHPMAQLSRVQDTWGNSLVRKKTFGLDGFPKSRKQRTAKQAGLSQSAEAEPFSKPKAAKKKAGPRQQAKTAAIQPEKENQSAAANQIPLPSSDASQSSKASRSRQAPVGPKLDKCGKCHTCLRPKLKKGCIWIKEQKALLAAQPIIQST